MSDIENLRIISATSFAFCDRQLNRLRDLASFFLDENGNAKILCVFAD